MVGEVDKNSRRGGGGSAPPPQRRATSVDYTHSVAPPFPRRPAHLHITHSSQCTPKAGRCQEGELPASPNPTPPFSAPVLPTKSPRGCTGGSGPRPSGTEPGHVHSSSSLPPQGALSRHRPIRCVPADLAGLRHRLASARRHTGLSPAVGSPSARPKPSPCPSRGHTVFHPHAFVSGPRL